MEERRAEIIIFIVFSVVAFLGGVFFAFSTPPTIYDLIASFFYGMASVGGALKVCDVIVEGQKADEEWRTFIAQADSEIKKDTPVKLNKNGHVEFIGIPVFGTQTLRKKRKKKKNGRRKAR